MRIRGSAYLVSIVGLAVGVGAGCSSSNNKPADAGHDLAFDLPFDKATTDTPIDMAPAADAPDAGPDAADAADGPAPGTITQKLSVTVIVTDQIGGGDGGFDAPAGAVEAGTPDAGNAPILPTVDPNLVNAWGLGIVAIPDAGTSNVWVADNHTGLGTTYTPQGAILPTVVTVPVPADGGVPPSAPTGLVLNGSATAFMADKVIFATEDGTISGWQTGATAVLRVDNSATNAVYKGLAIATMNGVPRLYATDFHNATVAVWDQTYAHVAPTGGFTDATIPAGFAPFGIQSSASLLWVTYAKQDAMKHDDMSGQGNGFVNVFDFNGTFVKRLISQGVLNSPWALVVAPADFGAFSNALLVGNFGDGHINAYDLATGFWRGSALAPSSGMPLTIDGLWSLMFGNDTAGAAHNRLFFTAGPGMENHGQLGHLDLP
jgi:uncharacterized protein (TIGR03118 family)